MLWPQQPRHLNVLRQRVENLLSDRKSFGEVQLSRVVDDVFTRVVPVKVADGLLENTLVVRAHAFVLQSIGASCT